MEGEAGLLKDASDNCSQSPKAHDSGVYLCQWVNLVVEGPGDVKKESQPLYKVGFGSPERPRSVAGQNPVQFAILARWPGTTLKHEKMCHDHLKSLGWHVDEDMGKEWFCAPGVSVKIIKMMVNGFILGTEGLSEDADPEGDGPTAKRPKSAGTSTFDDLTAKMLSTWEPPKTESQPSEEMKQALRQALKEHCSCSLPQKVKEFLNGSKMIFFVCAAFGSYTSWDGKDPYELRSDHALKRYLDAAAHDERAVYKGGNPCGPGSASQILGKIKTLHEDPGSRYRLYVTKDVRGVVVKFDTPTRSLEWVPEYPDKTACVETKARSGQ